MVCCQRCWHQYTILINSHDSGMMIMAPGSMTDAKRMKSIITPPNEPHPHYPYKSNELVRGCCQHCWHQYISHIAKFSRFRDDDKWRQGIWLMSREWISLSFKSVRSNRSDSHKQTLPKRTPPNESPLYYQYKLQRRVANYRISVTSKSIPHHRTNSAKRTPPNELPSYYQYNFTKSGGIWRFRELLSN